MYSFQELKSAILNNTKEVLPSTVQGTEALDKEILQLVELANSSNQPIKHYIGFEISGLVHLGTGISSGLKIKELTKAGVICHVFLADYHTFLNKKLDGKLETIIKVRDQYFKPCLEQCLMLLGVDMSKVVFISAYEQYNDQFWKTDLQVANTLTLSRVLKSISVTGKSAGEEVSFGVLRYPVMQIADAFFFGTHLVGAGMDQRKCHVLMREVAYKLDPEYQLKLGGKSLKPIAIHHNLLLGLAKPSEGDLEGSKMSKSNPDTAVFVHDSSEQIQKKIKKAYCPIIDQKLSYEDNIELQEFNPILDWVKKIIIPASLCVTVNFLNNDKTIVNTVVYTNFEDLQHDYCKGLIHPTELKSAVSIVLETWLAPITKWGVDNQEIINFITSIKK
jgi:tyrosyl-tRNA synthetase